MEQVNEAIVQNNPPAGGKRLKKSSRKPWAILGIILAVLAAAYVGLCAYANSLDTIYPNHTMRNIPVGGLTVTQAAERLAEEFPQQAFTVEVNITDVPDAEVTTLEIPYADLGATLDYEQAARIAAGELEDRSFFTKGWDYLTALWGTSTRNNWCSLTVDHDAFLSGMETLMDQITFPPEATAYEVTDNAILLTRHKDGLRISESDELAAFEPTLMQNLLINTSFTANLETVPAEVLTARQIHNEIAGEMKNAGYDAATASITPEKVGVAFDVAAAQAALDAAVPGETVNVPAVIEHPVVTAEELKEVLFRDVLGEYKSYVTGTAARITNVKLSAASINEYVMNTGDVFSYNEAVGQRTAENGYQAAPAYVRGETVDEIGGGICQTSSTLYLACLHSNLEITERYAHRYIPAYVPWGMDATVSWGGPDYKFTNNTNYPIKIVTEYNKGYLTVKILGTNVDGSYARVTNETLSTTPWETVYEEDPTLAPGTPETVKTTPYAGYKVRTFHTIYDKDGKVIDSHYEATSNYKVRNKVIVRAPAAPAVEPAVPTVAPGEIPAETPETTSPVTPTEPAAPLPDTPAEPGTPPSAETPDAVPPEDTPLGGETL